jgi:divalent metal cation (Fe/Co/Zn/Cd) transporter
MLGARNENVEKIKKAFPYVTDIVVHMESFIKKKNKKRVR